MKTTQFDALTGRSFTTELTDDFKIITGNGYFIIPNPNSKHVSFSKGRKDSCLGDIVSDIIPNYTNEDYAKDYGDRMTGVGKTVKEFLIENLKINLA